MRKRFEGLSAIYATSTIRSFALSMLGIYIPLYIFRVLEETIFFPTEQRILLGILFYYIMLRASILVFTLPASYFFARVKGGFRKSILLGNALLALEILFLILGEGNLIFLAAAGILGGMLIPFFWLPYHLIFVEDGSIKKFARQLSFLGLLGQGVGVLGPLLGGLIISYLGFGALLFSVLILVFLSSVPVFFMPHHEKHFVPPLSRLWREFWGRDFRSSLLSFLGAGAENVAGSVAWPLFIFTVVGSYERVGFLTSAVLLASLVVLLLTGKWADKKDGRKLLRAGGFLNSLFWGAKIFVQTVPQVFFVDSLSQVAKNFLWVPFDALTYKKAFKNPVEFLILREFALNGGRLLLLLLLALLIFFGINYLVAFALAAIGSLLVIWMTKGDEFYV